MGNKYRVLSTKEVNALRTNGCTSDAWELVKVTESFDTNFVKHSHFSGEVWIGEVGATIQYGIKKVLSGIYYSTVIESSIGNNCYINQVSGHLHQVDVLDNVIIDHCYCVENPEVSSFGNGVSVSVLNEAGGRSVKIFDRLSAQLAHVLTFYRYNSSVINAVDHLIDTYSKSKSSNRSKIGKGARLLNCSTLRNVIIGEGALLNSVLFLENGTILSSRESITKIGAGVIASDFIISFGAEVTESSNIKKTFVGEGTVVSNGCSINDSILLSNGQFYNGELCAVYAGPHTVTHHKSTLLIGGAFSFYNAGSGTNQSNHLYKIGPVHQGVTERGVKTGSDSYLLWPAHIGAFTVVLGRHYSHPDSADLPFSYLFEKDGESVLIPGFNLKSIGTYRDINKWPKRDKRLMPSQDLIDYDVKNWHFISKLTKAIDVLKSLLESKNSPSYSYKGVTMSAGSVQAGIKLYQQAIYYFIGLKLVAMDGDFDRFLLDPKVDLLKDFRVPELADVSGAYCDIEKLNQRLSLSSSFESISVLLNEINGCRFTINLYDELFLIRKYIWNHYDIMWSWEKKLAAFLADFLSATRSIHGGILQDAKKEFGQANRIGFGIDGIKSEDDQLDFDAVRGTFESLVEVKELNSLEKDIVNKVARYQELLNSVN